MYVENYLFNEFSLFNFTLLLIIFYEIINYTFFVDI